MVTSLPGPDIVARQDRMLDPTTHRRALSALFLSGMLFALPGALLPAWRHHLGSDYHTAGLYFLAVTIGMAGAFPIASRILPRRGIRIVLSLGSGIACASLLCLAAVPVAASPLWRLFGLAGVGLSIGLLNTAVFHALSDAYRHEPAATVNLGGAVFGLGSLITAVTVAGTFYVYTVPSILILLATLPGFHSGLFLKWPFPTYPQRPSPSLSEALHDFRSLGAVLFALLLFLQFGNEWAVAGWLPVFLTQRLGISPETSLWLLALYWLALIVGRISAQSILEKISHARLLFGSMLAAIFGCLILSVTNNLFGAVTGILLLGGGFASIYPLVVEKIGHRFPYYHPGFFNGIFSFALVGGLVAPWLLGHLAEFFGVGIVMALPAAGSVLVLVLLLLIWLEARMSEHTPPPGTSVI